MRIIILASAVITLVSINCIGQVRDSSKNQSNSNYLNTKGILVNKHLDEYKTAPCLFNLLSAIVKADQKSYDINENFYSLTFEKGKKYKYINVSFERWRAVKHLDYYGVIKIGNIKFLCRGEIKNDKIFQKVESSKLWVKLQQTEGGEEQLPFNVEPSLQGSYVECEGLPITLEIYTKNPIPGFKMKTLNSSKKQ